MAWPWDDGSRAPAGNSTFSWDSLIQRYLDSRAQFSDPARSSGSAVSPNPMDAGTPPAGPGTSWPQPVSNSPNSGGWPIQAPDPAPALLNPGTNRRLGAGLPSAFNLDPFASADPNSYSIQAPPASKSIFDGLGGPLGSVEPGELRLSEGFFSYLFGGPVPLTTPAGHTVGSYDHQAAATGLDILGKYAAIAPFLIPGDVLEAFPESGGARVANAITDGIEEAIERHHPIPKFMGGAANQDLVPLRQSLHRAFHQNLAAALRDDGTFPSVGGPKGSAADWAKHFETKDGSYEQAIEILRRVSGDFDDQFGTSISSKLDKELGIVQRNYKPLGK